MLKNSDVPKELKSFNSFFSDFQYKFEAHQIFDDLLTIIISCMGRGTSEELYFKTIKKYTKEELLIFSKLFGELVKIYDRYKALGEWCDPLGDYYEALASNYKKSNFGQFFTPKPVCDLMAQITLNNKEWGKEILEPCSGRGRLVMASNQISNGNYYVCCDLDPICCKMTAINLCFHEIRGEVHCQDSLKLDEPKFSLAVNYELWKHKMVNILMAKPLQ